MFEGSILTHGDGRSTKLITTFAKNDLIILDDWGLSKLTADQCRDLLALLNDRQPKRSTIVPNQISIDHWHEIIGDPTPADATLGHDTH